MIIRRSFFDMTAMGLIPARNCVHCREKHWLSRTVATLYRRQTAYRQMLLTLSSTTTSRPVVWLHTKSKDEFLDGDPSTDDTYAVPRLTPDSELYLTCN